MKKKIVVRDGRSDNLYKVESFGKRFVVHHVRVGFLFDSEKRVGSGSSLEEAVVLVKAHAGCSNVDIRPW